MICFNPVTREKGECIVVGRGAVGIWLALSEIEKKEGLVLVPSNICYAAVLPIYYAGYLPLFCDVDPISGNIRLDLINEVINNDVVSAIIPHMYGNPVEGILEIVEYLHKKGIVVIEDCASLMGYEGEVYIPGTVGDYVVYSTGYSKTIDIGFGGLLFSKDKSLINAEIVESGLPLFDDSMSDNWNEFSAIYRILRNKGENTMIAKTFYSGIREALRSSYIFSISLVQKEQVLESIAGLDFVIKQRRAKYELYCDKLSPLKQLFYNYSNNAVPWRFNILLDDNREEFISFCLKKGVPISDWYPKVTPVFGIEEEFSGASWHQEHILNFPIMIDDEEIDMICSTVLHFLRST